METREIGSDGLQELLELYKHLHSADDPLPNVETIERIWEGIYRNPDLYYFGVFDENKLVSSCTLSIIPNLTRACRPYGLVENVVTHSEYRRKGLGKAVLSFALERAWKQNCYKVMLLTGRMDEATFRFYESAGFDRQSKQAFIAKPKHTKAVERAR